MLMSGAADSSQAGNEHAQRALRVTYRATAEAIIYPVVPETGKPVRCLVLTQDVSSMGCNIVHPVRLLPGQRLDILLDGKTPRPAVVAWCNRLPDKHFTMGCRFTDEE